MGKYFGTDGFRGEANVDLTVEHAYKVGRFLGYYYGREGKAKIVIGKDTRRSGYMFEYSLVAGLTASGADVYLLHVTTTPNVAYTVNKEKFSCGIMISASHNAYYDNGIKVINSDGYKLEADVEEKIEEYIDSDVDMIPLAKRENIGKTIDYAIGRKYYEEHLTSFVKKPFHNYKIGLDLANGSASSIAKEVFDSLGATTYVIHNEPNGFNINLNCGSTHLEDLQKFVIKNKLDVGFAYDGDADRCLIVDNNGNIIEGDTILYLCAVYMKENGELNTNTVVTTIMSNLGLYKALDREGILYEKTAVGDKYVFENIMNGGHSLGGEQSGHFIFSKYATTGDGILTSLKVMEVMIDKQKSLSELAEDITLYPQLLRNIRVKSKKEAREDIEVIQLVNQIEKELGNEGRILVRESGTEQVIRVMVEAKKDEVCQKYVDQVINLIISRGHAQ
jgi:phosphoglucosamine mutase